MSYTPEENTYKKLEQVNSDIDKSIKIILEITQKGYYEESKKRMRPGGLMKMMEQAKAAKQSSHW